MTSGSKLLQQKLDSLIEEMISRGIYFSEAQQEFEKRFLTQILAREKGNLTRAARTLRIHRNTLSKKVQDYKLKVRASAPRRA